MKRRSPMLAVLLCGAGLAAQDSLPASRFLLPDYRNALHFDFAAMRKSGVWDEVMSSLLGAGLRSLESRYHFEFDHIDRLTKSGELPAEEGMGPRPTDVMIVEGNAEVSMVPDPYPWEKWTEESIGSYVLHHSGSDDAYAQVTPKLFVGGSRDLLERALRGETKNGVPSPDVMSLTAGRGRLAWAVLDVGHPMLRRQVLGNAFDGMEWPDDDWPQFLMVGLSATGDEDDPHVVLEATLRHTKDGEGLATSEKALDALLERLREMPQLRMLKPLLGKVERRRDRGDLLAKVDLGRARDAVGSLALVLAPVLLLRAEVAAQNAAALQVEVVEEVVVEEPPPSPPPAPKESGGG